jgi:primosomal protein N' (replication factor Y)
MTLYAEVALPLPLDQTFYYIVPELWQEQAKVGKRILVPLGERVLTGFITNLKKKRLKKELKLKEIKEVLDERPVFSPSFLSFAHKLSRHYFSSLGEMLQASLPPSYILKSKTTVFLAEKGKEALNKEALPQEEESILTLLQKRAYTPHYLQRKFKRKSISYLLSRMSNNGYINLQREVKKPVRRRIKPIPVPQRQLEIDFSLDRNSREVSGQIVRDVEKRIFSPFLLFGPKSRREAVYFHLIKKVLERGEKVLFLVPEISMTKSLIQKFEKRLGGSVVILHSQMSERERESGWQKIRDAEAEVVVGPRSALFSPFDDLRLVIVDEEHDDSYHQRENPSYDARKGAWLRAKEEKAVLVYGSAMPSVEAFYRAKKGRYLLRLEREERENRVAIAEERDRKDILGLRIREKIKEKLNKGEQVLIFINRRGYAPLLLCSGCSYIPRCISCDIALTYHKKEEKLICHYCNYSISKIEVCPECKSKIIRMRGFGIEAVEEELRISFPQSRVASFASDETSSKREQQRIIRSFSTGKIDILAGTQLLAYQTDLPSVSLIGILYPETILALSDYRASQKTFQTINLMMSHLRDESRGEVIIQTTLPSHFSIQTAASQDYVSFYNQEIKLRRLMNYPPFSHVAAVLFQGENLRILARKSREFTALLKNKAEDVEVLGPSLAGIKRLRRVYRVQLILKSKRRKVLDEALKDSLGKVRVKKSISVFS